MKRILLIPIYVHKYITLNHNCKIFPVLQQFLSQNNSLPLFFIIITLWLLLGCVVQQRYGADICCDVPALINKPITRTRLCLFYSFCCCFPLVLLFFWLAKGGKKRKGKKNNKTKKITAPKLCTQCVLVQGRREAKDVLLQAQLWDRCWNISQEFSSSWSKTVGQKSHRVTLCQDTSSECGLACTVFCAVNLILPSSHPNPGPLPFSSPQELFIWQSSQTDKSFAHLSWADTLILSFVPTF